VILEGKSKEEGGKSFITLKAKVKEIRVSIYKA
jgi:hypothetical protein